MAENAALSRSRVLAAAAVGCLAVGLAVQLPAYAAPAAGTWTRITTPAGEKTLLSRSGHEGQMTIKGKASQDVTTVNVYCLRGSGSSVDSTTLATSVPVSSGAFATTVPVPSGVLEPRCRMRAVPSGVSTQEPYLASYAGPQMNFDTWRYLSSQDTVQLRASTGTGTMVAAGIGICNASLLATVLPDASVQGGSDGCLYALRDPGADATHSSVRVDGHQAFTTGAALSYGLTPTGLATRSFRLLRSGGLRWTEVMPVDRCASDAAFPPNVGSCPTLVSSGISIRQVSTYLPDGQQVRMRARLRSVDGRRHAVRLDYQNTVYGLAEGVIGFRFPGQDAFHAAAKGQSVSKLGHGSGTMLVRNDRFATVDDTAVATRAMTWSRTPTALRFSATDPDTFALTYRLMVPKGGESFLGFADSDSPLTSRAGALGRQGQADMMTAPRIVSPARGAVVRGRTTKVTGVVKAGANGLPTSVTVNGHAAKLRPSHNGAKARFTVTFTESLGKHRLKAVAKDAAGNTRTSSVRVTNK